jgi:membrane protease YdiL (CAAX protease family)
MRVEPNQLFALVPEPVGGAALPVSPRRAGVALVVCLIFGFSIPIMHAPGLTGFFRHAFGLTPIVAWGIAGDAKKLCVLFFLPLAVIFWEHRPLSSLGLRRPTMSEASLGIGIFILTEVAALLALVITRLVIMKLGWGSLSFSSAYRDQAASRLLALPIGLGILGAVINGIVEELVARGYAIERLEALTRSTFIAAAIALIADVAMHIPYWGLLYAIDIAPAQLVFVLAYLWRRDLTSCIAAHILNDAFPYLVFVALPAWMAVGGHMSYQAAAGWAANTRGDYAAAVEHLSKAIKQRPHDAMAYEMRAYAYAKTGQPRSALDDYDQLLKLKPADASAINSVAWILATSFDAALRDGSRAVMLAQKACDLTAWKKAGFIDTLAAAYATKGDFEKAIGTEQRALTLSGKGTEGMKSRLELYVEQRPYRDLTGSAACTCTPGTVASR